jgi:hypothetical protein
MPFGTGSIIIGPVPFSVISSSRVTIEGDPNMPASTLPSYQIAIMTSGMTLATPKSISLGTGLVVGGDQHVRRLEAATNDPLLMIMLQRMADGDKKLQPLAERQA